MGPPPLRWTPTVIGVLCVIYGFSSYSNGFQGPSNPWIEGVCLSASNLDADSGWRVLSSTLAHASLDHLLSNCFAVAIFLRLVERRATDGQLTLITVLGMLTASGAWVLFGEGCTVGYSGVAMAYISTYLTMLVLDYKDAHPRFFRQQLKQAMVFGLVFLGLDLYHYWSGTPVAVWGHVGGFAGGILSAWIIHQFWPQPDKPTPTLRVVSEHPNPTHSTPESPPSK